MVIFRYNIRCAIGLITSGTTTIIGGTIAYAMGFIDWSIMGLGVGIPSLIIGLGILIYEQRKLSSGSRAKRYDERTKELYEATERKLYNYLESNKGKAYTAPALVKRIMEDIKHPYFKKYVKRNADRILSKMSINEEIQIARKDEKIHYFLLQQE